MPDPLKSLVDGVAADPGLRKNISDNKIAKGVQAAQELNAVLMKAINATGANEDGLLDARDMARVSSAVYDKPAQYVTFLEAHGNDNGDVVSGFHHVQGDGGTLVFQGRDFIDTVADAIYHYGFKVINGRYVNEDGAANETAKDVAGWLNYFLNGENVVFGGKGADQLGTGAYSKMFKDANNETFYAGKGDDKIWAGKGRDKIYGEAGNDTSGGGTGNDKMWGGANADRLSGDEGNDKIWGGSGRDVLYGGDGADTIYGGAGLNTIGGGKGNDDLFGGHDNDRIDGNDGHDLLNGDGGRDLLYGGDGNDRIIGGKGLDRIYGSDGRDKLFGKGGNDTLSAGAGKDVLSGGKGRDTYHLWENNQAVDTIVLKSGDSGRKSADIDFVEGFDTDHDLIDLSAFGGLKYKNLDFAGGGKASVYFDGTYLRIDEDGNRSVDMMIEFKYASDFSTDNFIL